MSYAKIGGRPLWREAKIHIYANEKPVFCKAHSVPHMMRAKIECTLDRFQIERVISPVEFSVWACPIVSVLKSDGSIRICGDYKMTINKYSKHDQYPLPKADDLFAAIYGGQKFSRIDLESAYTQMLLDDDSRQYTCINNDKGLFVYNCCPFGIKSASLILQRSMENPLKGIPFVVAFQDDVLISC